MGIARTVHDRWLRRSTVRNAPPGPAMALGNRPAIGAWAAVGLLLLAAAGCGVDVEPEQRRQAGASGIAGTAPVEMADVGQPQPRQSTASAKRPATTSAKASKSAAGRKGAPDDGTASDQNGTAPAESGDAPAAKDKPEEAKSRPEAVADWKPTDFASARAEGDPKLAEAVADIAKKSPTSADTAQLLVQLLMIEPKGPAAGKATASRQAPGRGRRPAVETGKREGSVTQAILLALTANSSPPARQAIADLLSGKLQSSLPRREAITELTAALAQNASPENEKILLEVVTRPQSFAPPPQPLAGDAAEADEQDEPRTASRDRDDTVPPEWIQSVGLEAAKATAPAAFRQQMAAALDDASIPVEIAEPLERFLTDDDPRNLAAQILLYKNKHTAEQVRTGIEDRLTAGSTAALAYLLDVPDQQGRSDSGRRDSAQARGRPEPVGRPSPTGRPSLVAQRNTSAGSGVDKPPPNRGPSTAAQRPADPREVHSRFAELLWTPPFADILEAALRSPTDSTTVGASRPLLLAGTIPTERSRQMIYQLLIDRSDEGPQEWTAAGLLGREVCDPAILVLVKDVHHASRKGPKRRSARPRESTSHGQKPPPAQSRGESDEDGNRESDREREEDDWSKDTMQFVKDLCARFGAAAAWTGPGTDEGAKGAANSRLASLPLRLHKNANVVAEYHTTWPDQVSTRLPGIKLAPLALHYIRIEEDQPSRLILAHYRRQVPSLKEEEDGDSRWLNGFGRDREKGTERSVDVCIGEIEQGARSENAPPMTVEILTIEIPNPRGVADAESSVKSQSSEAGGRS